MASMFTLGPAGPPWGPKVASEAPKLNGQGAKMELKLHQHEAKIEPWLHLDPLYDPNCEPNVN